ncbi:uncharacterized protein LOC111103697 isoform X2 [Crassostrea virginica]|nr:uncharacterized protein LOC111103697 isoform X2 [Crassostrea virginica]
MDTDTTHSMVESFQDLDGRSLLQMTPEDFRGISEEHGQFIYEIFKQMCTVDQQLAGLATVQMLPPILEGSRSPTPSPPEVKGDNKQKEEQTDVQKEKK